MRDKNLLNTNQKSVAVFPPVFLDTFFKLTGIYTLRTTEILEDFLIDGFIP